MEIKIDTNEIKNMDELANQLIRVTRETKWKIAKLELEIRKGGLQ